MENAWIALKARGPLSLAVELVDNIERFGSVSDGEKARLRRISSNALNSLGRSAEARTHLEDGLACAIRSRDVHSECRLRCSIGDHDAAAGHMSAALEHLEVALGLARRLEDAELQSLVLNSLGDHRARTGQLDQAYNYFEEALVLARRAGSRRLEGGFRATWAWFAPPKAGGWRHFRYTKLPRRGTGSQRSNVGRQRALQPRDGEPSPRQGGRRDSSAGGSPAHCARTGAETTASVFALQPRHDLAIDRPIGGRRSAISTKRSRSPASSAIAA